MPRLFKPVQDGDRRDPRLTVRFTRDEIHDLEQQALVRNMSPSEFVRRAVFQRRADVKIETEMILQVINAVTAIKKLHAVFIETGSPPPVEEHGAVIFAAIEAITNLSRY